MSIQGTTLGQWFREGWFLSRDRTAVGALIFLVALSVFSALIGLGKIAEQRQAIDVMIEADAAERATVQSRLSSYGDAGYYSFYITYDKPSALAFSAFGQRDTAPYMKRIRLLAIEGQIYQGESPNPLLAQIGSFDLAFIAAYILPLVLIVLLYDLKAGESAAGRLQLLQSLSGSHSNLWRARVFWRAVLAFMCVAVPFVVAAVYEGAEVAETLIAVSAIAAICIFWTLTAVFFANKSWRSVTIAASLIGLWLALNILVPLTAQMAFVSQVSSPDGSDVALMQREAVNDAWDVPKENTLKPFEKLYPQYSVEGDIRTFDWRWYFAFQTMGDVAANNLSEAYRDTTLQRDDVAAYAAWMSPALALQRCLQGLANTDVKAQLAYRAAIRRYHRALQDFYFPMIFGKTEFNKDALSAFPAFEDSL